MSYVPVGSSDFSAWEFIETVTISSQATVDLDLTGSYETYVIHIDDLVPATNATEYLQLLFSTDAGSTFLNTAGDYDWSYFGANTVTIDNESTDAGATDTEIPISRDDANFLGTATAEGLNGFIYIHNANQATNGTMATTAISYTDEADVFVTINTRGGLAANIDSVDAIRLLASSGNLTSGRISLYGVNAGPSLIEFVGAALATTPADQGNAPAAGPPDELIVPVPDGVQENDVLLMVERWAGNAVLTPPSGWTLLESIATGIAAYTKTAGASEPSDYTWDGDNASGRAGCMVAFRNCTLGDSDVTAGSSSSPVTVPTVTALANGAALVALSGKPLSSFAGVYAATSPLIEAAQHEGADNAGANLSGSFIAYELGFSAGDISGKQITHNQSVTGLGAIGVVLEPV